MSDPNSNIYTTQVVNTYQHVPDGDPVEVQVYWDSTQVAEYVTVNAGIPYVQVSISSAELLALHDSPKTIIPTQGSGYFIVPIAIIFDYTNVTTAYTSGALNFQLGGTTFTALGNSASIGSSSSIARQLNISAAGTSASPSAALTEGALTLTSASNPTGGDGTAKVTVYYQIMAR